MKDKIVIEVTRASVARMVARLREFLLQGGVNIRQSNGYECVSRILGFPNWNVMSARFPNEDAKYGIQNLTSWAPPLAEDPWSARLGGGAVLVVIPSHANHAAALKDVRALFVADEGSYRHQQAVLVHDFDEWPWDDDDEFSMLEFPQEWRKDHQEGVRHLLDFRYARHLLVPLADDDLVGFMADASIATVHIWGFLIADGYSDAVAKLVQSEDYLRIGRANNFRLLMWPFNDDADNEETVGDRAWMTVLKRRLIEAHDADRQRYPLSALSEVQFRRLVELAQRAKITMQERRRAREAEADFPGRFTFEEDKCLIELPENAAKFDFLEALGLFALVEVRALLRLGLGWDEGMSWASVVGSAYNDLARLGTFQPWDFVGGTPDMSSRLLEGLRIAKELQG